ncbi:MAG: hypothetical protein GY804_08790 [Alphaproteobacteria bacterium]|nr:hypothetical protein [Alphaproteobacteria bacterium]
MLNPWSRIIERLEVILHLGGCSNLKGDIELFTNDETDTLFELLEESQTYKCARIKSKKNYQNASIATSRVTRIINTILDAVHQRSFSSICF